MCLWCHCKQDFHCIYSSLHMHMMYIWRLDLNYQWCPYPRRAGVWISLQHWSCRKHLRIPWVIYLMPTLTGPQMPHTLWQPDHNARISCLYCQQCAVPGIIIAVCLETLSALSDRDADSWSQTLLPSTAITYQKIGRQNISRCAAGKTADWPTLTASGWHLASHAANSKFQWLHIFVLCSTWISYRLKSAPTWEKPPQFLARWSSLYSLTHYDPVSSDISNIKLLSKHSNSSLLKPPQLPVHFPPSVTAPLKAASSALSAWTTECPLYIHGPP